MQTFCNNNVTDSLIPSNLIPHEWYKKFSDKNGRPDLHAIVLMGDILGWYRSLTRNEGRQIYENNNLPELKEDALAISYDYLSTKLSYSKTTIRRTFARLEEFGVLKREIRNVENTAGERVNKVHVHIDNIFFRSCLRNAKTDIRATIEPSKPVENRSEQSCSDPIISNNNKDLNNRSMKSNFKNLKFFEKPRTLKQLYPLSQEDCTLLQKNSCRDFNLQAMNEILNDMGRKLPDHSFKTQSAFMNYMSKVFTHELREPVKINNDAFKILPPEVRKQENYLRSIEEHPDYRDRFKIQLANVFPREKAYDILTAYKYDTKQNNKATIYFNRYVDLTQPDKQTIMRLLQDKYFTITSSGIDFINELEIVMPSPLPCSKEYKKENVGIWAIVYHELAQHGDIVSKWLHELTVKVKEEQKTVTIYAPKGFIFDTFKTRFIPGSIRTYEEEIIATFDKYGYKSELKKTGEIK